MSAAYAAALAKAGHEIIKYEPWKLAQLADGTQKPMISGYCIADIVLRTKAGDVVLTNTHIDVLQGPEHGNLLYVGQQEEDRLGLRSFRKQIEDLAANISSGKGTQPAKPKKNLSGKTARTTTVESDGGFKTVRFEPGAQPTYKRRLRLGSTNDQFGHLPGKVKADGFAYVGEKGWKAMEKTRYVMDPMVQGIYVTSAAVQGQDLKLAKDPPSRPVKTYDLSNSLREWIGEGADSYTCEIVVDVRVGPDANRDTVDRLTTLSQVTARVIESKVPAVILGHDQIELLTARKAESLEFKADRSGEEAEIRQRLEDVVASARLQGMSEAGIAEGRKLIQQEFPDIWRLSLGPGDYADVPPLEFELKDPDQRLPKPYTKRYTKEELRWWRKHVDSLRDAGVICKSSSTDLSPANLVDKLKDGVARLDDHRIVIDLRKRNSNAKPRHFHLPRLDDLWHHLVGAKVFASVDATKGYLQFLLAVKSRKYAAFLTPFGAYELCRVPMGWVDAAAYYQETMTCVLDELIYVCVLQYLDDGLIFAAKERGLLDALRAYFTVMRKHNIKLHPGKFVLFAKSLTWGGHDLNGDGIKPASHRMKSVEEMPEPVTLADAMTFVYGVAWFRNHIPYFAEIAGPLYDLWNKAMEGKKRRTTQAASRIKLCDLPGWDKSARSAFAKVKEAFAEAIRTSFYDPELRTCVFTDANDGFWCILITQCKDGDQLLPWAEQVGKHRPLLFESGRYRNAQLHWHTVSKEAFPFGEKIFDYKHWINGGRYESSFFTDHKNLLAVFDDEARPDTCTKSNRKRLDRWAERMMTLRYLIHHIDGAENRLADLGTRWGNRFSKTRKTEGDMKVTPKMFLRSLIRPDSRRARKTQCKCATGGDPTAQCNPVGAAAKRAFWTPEPATTKTVVPPDRNVNAATMLPTDLLQFNRATLYEAQKRWSKSRPAGLKRTDGANGLWKNKSGAFWVPDKATEVQFLLYAAAHQGLAGHRGRETTLKRVKREVFWSTMDQDIRRWHADCLQCLKLSDGSSIPRPDGTTLIAEKPGEVMMMDYIDMGEESEGKRYILMCADKYSRLVELEAAAAPTSIKATQATLRWSARYGIPDWIISDGGSHFKNRAMQLLTDQMGIQHHITLAYCPWANGAIEIFGRQLLWTTRALLSELGYSATDWTLVHPLINMILNHRERDVLCGKTPIEVMMGRAPRTPINMVLWDGLELKDATGVVVTYERVAEYVNDLAATLDALHQKVSDRGEQLRRNKAAKAANDKRGLQFEIGDLVMVAAWGNAAHVKRSSKLCPTWQGPYEIVSPISPTSYEVRLLGRPDKQPKPVHWSRMKRFADAGFDISERLVRTAVNDCQKFDVQEFVAWREGDDGSIQLKVRWEGFEPQDDTWQDLQGLSEDVPAMVRKYLRQHAGESEALDAVAATLQD